MHKNATKCNETLSKWCKNKHGASKIIDTFETYQYKDPDQSYMVFETEKIDKQSLYRRSMEVNVVMSTVPRLMYWSDQAIG
jgi:hypothetical protein